MDGEKKMNYSQKGRRRRHGPLPWQKQLCSFLAEGLWWRLGGKTRSHDSHLVSGVSFPPVCELEMKERQKTTLSAIKKLDKISSLHCVNRHGKCCSSQVDEQCSTEQFALIRHKVHLKVVSLEEGQSVGNRKMVVN